MTTLSTPNGGLRIALSRAWRQQRTKELRTRFGPEYERTVERTDGRRRAESELRAREQRRERLDIRSIPPNERERYVAAWRQVQASFVDRPALALQEADALVHDLMRGCGYPMNRFEQRAADVSVDHPYVVENYRAAHDVSVRAEEGDAGIEDMRQGLVHYRALFEELLDVDRVSDLREVR
ncbi:MAG TPA: hypothetical protein VF984_02480 [Actinomycetota bacterium]